MYTNVPFDKMMIVRTVVLILAWVNQWLVLNGYETLPFDNQQIEIGVTTFITFLASLWSWWKNNAVTRKARQAEELAKQKGLK